MTSTRAINAAAAVIHACIQQGKPLPASIAYALGSAGLLNSPEHAAEVANLRVMYDVVSQRENDLIEERDALLTRVDALEIELTGSCLDRWEEEQDAKRARFAAKLARQRAAKLRAQVAELIQQRDRISSDTIKALAAGDGSTRPVDEDPIAYSLTVEALHASSGAVIETPSRREQSTAKLRGILARQQAAVEGSHETPPRPRPTPHDLPEVTPAECPPCGAPADSTGYRIPEHRTGCPWDLPEVTP